MNAYSLAPCRSSLPGQPQRAKKNEHHTLYLEKQGRGQWSADRLRHQAGSNPYVCWTATVYQAPFGVFYVKIIIKPCKSHCRTSSLLLFNTWGSWGFSKELIWGHLVGKEVDESGYSRMYPELTSPVCQTLSVRQWAAFWRLSLKGLSACSQGSQSVSVLLGASCCHLCTVDLQLPRKVGQRWDWADTCFIGFIVNGKGTETCKQVVSLSS